MSELKNDSSHKIRAINGIKISNREIEIISCVLNRIPAKTISTLLSITPNTVNSHLRNIMLRLKCSSREQIIKLIESSNNHLLFYDKYREIKFEYEFIKLLKNITSKFLIQKPRCKIYIFEDKDALNHQRLITDLAKAGIYAEMALESAPTNFSSENILLAVEYNSKNGIELCYINRKEPFDYYGYLLECIDKICKNKDVSQLIDEFKKFYDRLSNSEVLDSMQNISEKKPNNGKTKFGKLLLPILIFCAILGAGILYCLRDSSNEISNFQVFDARILLPRTTLINEINTTFNKQNNKKLVILAGQGGAGKTTLARLYLQFQKSKIKWEINAETNDSTLKSFFDLANLLADSEKLKKDLSYIKICQNEEEKIKQLMQFVFSCLNEKKTWILLFDNVEDFQQIHAFLPFSKKFNGDIIITTRNETLSNVAYFPADCMIKVGDLDKNEQAKLFCNILYGDEKKLDKEVCSFLKNIPLMPLDTAAVAYYLKNTNDTFEHYLKLTSKKNEEFEKLNCRFLSENVGYSSTRYDIIVSTFKHILQYNSDFKKLLLFVCLGDSQNIQKNLKCLKNSIVTNDFFHNLKKCSLITKNGDNFSIHRSTQEIGLNYILSILTDEEKEKYMNEIITFMTRYDEIMLNLSHAEITSMSPHIEAMIKNIKNKDFPNSNLYNAKLLLTLFCIFYDSKSQTVANNLGEKILNLNNGNNYIVGYDMAILLSSMSRNYIHLENFEKAQKTLNECLKICSSVDNAKGIEAICIVYLAWIHCERGEFDKGIKLLKKAENLISKINNIWKVRATITVCNRYAICMQNHYINKPEIKKTILFLLDTLKLLGSSDLFYKSKNCSKKYPRFASTLRARLATAYNRIGEYNQALDCEYETYYFYEKRQNSGAFLETNIDTEYAYTLLRKNDLKKAIKILDKSIYTKILISDYKYLFYALVYRSEVNIRLNNFKEAYEDCKKALEIDKICKQNHNFNKLQNSICYYNMAIAKHKQKDNVTSLKHFEDFFKDIKKFCEEFLEGEKLKHLKNIKSFEFHENIKICLKNSLEIFKAIYGEEHSFVINYVSNN